MSATVEPKVETLFLKGMLCNCCMRTVRELLEKQKVEILSVRLGKVVFVNNTNQSIHHIEKQLELNGFAIVKNKELILVEQIRAAVVELIHLANNSNSLIRNSDYLVEKLGYSYSYLSSVFSKIEGITLEKFIILHKIEKVKELIDYGELSLSEIADMMGYSSVQYLSNQFKNLTGSSVSDYKKGDGERKPIDSL